MLFEMGKKFILIDANSLAYRAFFALPTTLMNSKGEIVNAVYGFSSMLIKLLNEEKPDVVIAAFDRKGPTFRHERYEDYKANRLEMPDELKPQFPLIKEVLKVFGVPILEVEGYEADDIIATLSKRLKEKGEVYIVTADRDALQLVSENVKVISTKKGISEVKVYDRSEVEKRFGISPQKIPDMLGLMGEASDNIPGVPGVGEKTAVQLVKEFGSLEKVLKNVEKIKKPSLKRSLEENKEQAVLSKSLATLDENAPVEIDLDKVSFQPDYKKVKNLFRSLEFYTLLKRLEPERRKIELKEAPLPQMVKVCSEEEMKDLLGKVEKAGRTGLFAKVEGGRLSGTLSSIYLSIDGEVASISLQSLEREFLVSSLSNFFENATIRKYVINFKDLAHYFLNEGLSFKGAFDVSIASHLLNTAEGSFSLESLLERHLKMRLEGKEKGNPSSKAFFLFLLGEKLKGEIEKHNLDYLFYEVEMPLSVLLMRMEKSGILLDKELLEDLGKELEGKLEKLEEEAYFLVGEEFNLNSPQQVGEVLFEKLKLAKKKRTKTGYSTDLSVLTKLLNAHPVVEKIIQYRELSKLKSTYVDALPLLLNPKTNRLHTSFNQIGTATGRLSSENPNLQNIPVRGDFGLRIREAFTAPPGSYLLSADYSQIDLRVLAHLSKDEVLLEAFRKREDIHTKTAQEIFGVFPEMITPEQRRIAKGVNFGVIYGISAQGLSEQLGIKKKEAEDYIEKYFQRHRGVKRYVDEAISRAYQNGYVETMFGRRRYISELKSDNIRIRNYGERLALNTPIQGSSADIIKIAMVKVGERLEKEKLKSKLLLQVHDELLLEVPRDELEVVKSLVKEEMERACELQSGLLVELSWGKNWREAK
jgi:DNA polymerase-1